MCVQRWALAFALSAPSLGPGSVGLGALCASTPIVGVRRSSPAMLDRIPGRRYVDPLVVLVLFDRFECPPPQAALQVQLGQLGLRGRLAPGKSQPVNDLQQVAELIWTPLSRVQGFSEVIGLGGGALMLSPSHRTATLTAAL